VFLYTYTISDGVTYMVQGTLNMTTNSQFATAKDLLGNPYQTVVNVLGTRVYTHIPTGASIVSTVSGVSRAANPLADQRFYPYALLDCAPGVYTMTTAPFFDSNGVEFAINPPTPVNGVAPGTGVQYNATTLYFTTPEPTAVLTEGYYINLPSISYQQQTYSF